MSKRLWSCLGTTAAVAAAVDGALLLRGGDLVLATLVVFAAVGSLAVAFEASIQSPTAWARQPTSAPGGPPTDAGLAGLRRVITDNQSARTPDRVLQDRLVRLADARRGPRSAGEGPLEDLRNEQRPVRFSPTHLARLIEEIEHL